jgi:hypothetical protein
MNHKEKPEIAKVADLITSLDDAVSERNKKHNPLNMEIIQAGFNYKE